MKRVLVTSAGGAPSIGLARSLKMADEPIHVIGIDCDKYRIHRAATDEKYLVPRADDSDYLPVLRSVIAETHADLVCVQMSAEMLAISAARDTLGTRTLLPRHRTIDICENKFASQQVWEQAGLPVPKTILINDNADLHRAFHELGTRLWVRAIRGSAGKDALPVDDFETAQKWIDLKKGWGTFTAAERLEPQSITWQSIWKDGELLIAQGRKRLYWEFGNRTPSGVTGVTGAGETVADPVLDEIAMASILAIDPKPSGIFGVDLTYDKKGLPNLTEINSGRFFTTHQFFTNAGLNLPYLFVKAAFDEPLPPIPQKINPLPSGLLWIRGMDVEPVLTTVEEVDVLAEELKERRQRLQQGTPRAVNGFRSRSMVAF